MGRACTVCVHSRKADIDTRLKRNRTPIVRIAAEFNITRDALNRHLANHLIPSSAIPPRRDRRLTTKANRQTGQASRARERFLEAYAESGCVSTAAKWAGVTRSRV